MIETMSDQTIKIGWKAPSNIALVKYWGKRDNQLPDNGSLSVSLDRSSTSTFLTFNRKEQAGGEIDMEYYFHGNKQAKFSEKIFLLLNKLLYELPFLTDYRLVFESENNFPHSAGIASSASSMAALALCLVNMEQIVKKIELNETDFFRRASFLARHGSGSAARSVYGGVVSWGKIASIDKSSDDFATPFSMQNENRMNMLRDAILIVGSEEKYFSSSSGHAAMADHPYREGRRAQAKRNLELITQAIQNKDFKLVAKISENEALSLHALLLSSAPGILLLKPNTLRIIQEIRHFREITGYDLFFTIDAGPNVHLIYFEDQREIILPFVRDTLSQFCENGTWIDDQIGTGPKLLTPQTGI